ncbi:hypothetical protein [Sphingomonas sp.]|uniref:hypothetical protein n=1 Tax=Sphingomonas sp. TaxID=28214 RepID=UPI0025F14942|nr:hypothetical protein [Sphingomonas sp.]
MSDLDFLKSEAEARGYVEGILAGLDDALHGRTVPHEQIVRDIEERRRRYSSAAE